MKVKQKINYIWQLLSKDIRKDIATFSAIASLTLLFLLNFSSYFHWQLKYYDFWFICFDVLFLTVVISLFDKNDKQGNKIKALEQQNKTIINSYEKTKLSLAKTNKDNTTLIREQISQTNKLGTLLAENKMVLQDRNELVKNSVKLNIKVQQLQKQVAFLQRKGTNHD